MTYNVLQLKHFWNINSAHNLAWQNTFFFFFKHKQGSGSKEVFISVAQKAKKWQEAHLCR